MYDVLIVGAGQCGLSTAFGLMRDRVSNVLCLDENEVSTAAGIAVRLRHSIGPHPRLVATCRYLSSTHKPTQAGQEGPWVTYARMVTLRTPKHLTGLDLGMPSLTFQSYYEARFGAAAWASLDKIPRHQWMAYLQWYRQVLGIPVRNGVRVDLLEPLEEGSTAGAGRTLFKVHVTHTPSGKQEALLARKVSGAQRPALLALTWRAVELTCQVEGHGRGCASAAGSRLRGTPGRGPVWRAHCVSAPGGAGHWHPGRRRVARTRAGVALGAPRALRAHVRGH